MFPSIINKPYTMHKIILATIFVLSITASEAQYNDQLSSNQELKASQRLVSKNRQYYLEFQTDGNLVLYSRQGSSLWASKTDGKPVTRCVMQDDGNFVIYNVGTAVWSSKTEGNPNSRLVLQDDGNLVIYNRNNKSIWAAKKTDQSKASINDQVVVRRQIKLGTTISSLNGVYELAMQRDGNLVLYRNCSGRKAIWESNTDGKSITNCIITPDGHIMLMNRQDIVKKIPDDNNSNNNSRLVIQDDGNLVFYNGNMKPFWSSNTMQGPCN